MGNITMNLARMTRLPLLVLPTEGQPSPDHAPVFLATDGSANAGRAQERFRQLVSDNQEGRIIWVRPEDAPDEAEQVDRLVYDLAESMPSVNVRILDGQPAKELLNMISDIKPALVLIGKRGTTPVEMLPLGHTSESVVRESLSPVLLIP